MKAGINNRNSKQGIISNVIEIIFSSKGVEYALKVLSVQWFIQNCVYKWEKASISVEFVLFIP